MTLPAFLGNSGIKKLFTWPVHPHGPCFCMGDKPSPSPAATSSPSRGKPLVKRSGEPLPAAPSGAATSPEGGGLGKEGRFRPHSLTAERIQLLSCKLFALAKASPFRERWHGEAVTERVASGTNPLSLAALDSSPEGRALGRTGEFRPPFVNGRKKSADKR